MLYVYLSLLQVCCIYCEKNYELSHYSMCQLAIGGLSINILSVLTSSQFLANFRVRTGS